MTMKDILDTFVGSLINRPVNLVQHKGNNPKRHLKTHDACKLKCAIWHRLNTEDYTCRMVDKVPYLIKPRIRYKLTKQCIRRHSVTGAVKQSFFGIWVYR